MVLKREVQPVGEVTHQPPHRNLACPQAEFSAVRQALATAPQGDSVPTFLSLTHQQRHLQ